MSYKLIIKMSLKKFEILQKDKNIVKVYYLL